MGDSEITAAVWSAIIDKMDAIPEEDLDKEIDELIALYRRIYARVLKAKPPARVGKL